MLSPAERAKYVALTHEPTRDEKRAATDDVQGWLDRIRAVDAQAKSGTRAAAVPPPRGSAAAAAATTARARAAREPIDDAPAAPAAATLLSPVELDAMAEREKQKGNECFREGDYSRAAQYYSRSLEYRPAAPLVLCNRAQARIKLKQFDFAVEDCDAALRGDAKLVKAWVRRATARVALGRFAEAIPDLETAAQLDHEHGGGAARSEIQRLLEEAFTKAAAANSGAAAATGSKAAAAEAPVVASGPAPTGAAPAPSAPLPAAPASRGRRLKIVEEEEDAPPDAAPPASPAATAAADVPPVSEGRVASVAPVVEAPGGTPDAGLALAATEKAVDTAASAVPPPALPTTASPVASAWEAQKAAGNVAFQQGRHAAALVAYRAALDAAVAEGANTPPPHVGRAAVRCNVALVLLRERDFRGAVATCGEVLADLGVDDGAVASWAAAHEATGDLPEVPDDVTGLAVKALFRRATALLELAPLQLESLLRDLRAAVALEPSNEKVRQLLREASARAPPSPPKQQQHQPDIQQGAHVTSAASSPEPQAAGKAAAAVSSPALLAAAKSTVAGSAPGTAGPPQPQVAHAPTPPSSAAAARAATESPVVPQRTPVVPGTGKSPAVAVQAAAAAAAAIGTSSPVLTKAQPWQRAPVTAMDFEKSCKALRGDPAVLSTYLRAHLGPDTLPSLFSRRALEPDTLTSVINALHYSLKGGAVGLEDARHAASILASVVRTRDSATVLLMASSGDRQKLRETLAAIEAHGGAPQGAAAWGAVTSALLG